MIWYDMPRKKGDHEFPKGTMLEINIFNLSLLYLHVVLSEVPFALNVLIFSYFNNKNYLPLTLYKVLKSKYHQNTIFVLNAFIKIIKCCNLFSLSEL